MAKDTQSRKWQITINNPKEKGFTHERIKAIMAEMKNVVYWCMADEVGGDKGTYHTHIYMHFSMPKRFSTLLKVYNGAHFEMARGTASQNRDYVFKVGKYLHDKKADTRVTDTQFEYGDVPIERQGQRNDIIDLYDMIQEGKTNFEILQENPEYMDRIDKIERVRQILKEEQFKNTWRDIEVVYIHGKTGTGKTRGVMDKYGYANVYRVTDYKNPWDGYKGQDVVIFEEFRSSFRIAEMLNYLDNYPLELPARYTNRIACYTKVYLISNEPLQNQYKTVQHEQSETWNAFLRRIDEVHYYDGETVHKYDTNVLREIENLKYHRTNKEIDDILNARYKDIEKKHAGNVLFL